MPVDERTTSATDSESDATALPKRSPAHYRAAIDVMPIGICIADRQTRIDTAIRDGVSVGDAVMRLASPTPIIALTADVMVDAARENGEQLFAERIAKPFRKAVLFDAIRRVTSEVSRDASDR